MSNMRQVTANGMRGASGSARYNGTPDKCPLCHRQVEARVVDSVCKGNIGGEGSELRVIFQCPSNDCNEVFIGYYESIKIERSPQVEYFFQDRTAPTNPEDAELPHLVCDLSPNFVKIYNQALAAEAFNLDEITGIGLRKALEFLIKDFLIHENPGNAEEIKSKFLGTCIEEKVTDTNLKATAKRATWLGNDETHYVRKWEGKDIKDLKVLIRLTINWVDSVLLTQKYTTEMNT